MRQLLILLLFLFPFSISANNFLHRDGAVIRDADNKEVKLDGVNLGGWLLWEGWIWGGKFSSQSTILSNMGKLVGPAAANSFRDDIFRHFIGEDDIRRISELKMNVVRVPFNHRIFDTAYCNAIGWQIMDSLVHWCSKYHVYAVLDMHGAPGGQSNYFIADPDTPFLWKTEADKQKTVALWKKIAARYKDERWVAGYDLLNEPIPPSDPELVKMYNRIIPAIREVDKNHMIFLEGSQFATRFKGFTSLPDENMAFSFHVYTFLGGKPEKKIGDHITLGQKFNVPIWCGEWGENNYEALQHTLDVITDPKTGFDGWCFWTWKKVKKPNSTPALNGINMSGDWMKLIGWYCKPSEKDAVPAATAQKLNDDFRNAMHYKNCTHDEKLSTILSNYTGR